MNFNLSKYSKLIKLISLIPVILGLTTFADLILPLKQIETTVISKDKSYRAKFDNTTYKIRFDNNNDQFTEEIFNSVNKGDDVTLMTTYLHEETRFIVLKSLNKTLKNDTYEIYFQLLIALVMIIPVFFWFKKYSLTSKQAKYILIISLIGLAGMFRLIKTLL